jgi:hypothetical protein
MLLKKLCSTPRLLCVRDEDDEALSDTERSELGRLYQSLLAPCLKGIATTAFTPDISGRLL